jgi:2-amino-4-hydroxy-6-hydroxymethyldihydropteridine diphosphokinase/dihydropteroate synthase
MRSFHSGVKLGVRVSRTLNVWHTRASTTSIKFSTPITSVRWQSSESGNANPPQWTPHSMNAAKSPRQTQESLPIPSHMLTPAAQKHTAYIALGSNLGDRIGWIEKACNLMSERGITVKRTSCLWETAPMYVEDQNNFVNGACEVCHLILTHVT